MSSTTSRVLTIGHQVAARVAAQRGESIFLDGHPLYTRTMEGNLLPGLSRSDIGDDVTDLAGDEPAGFVGRPHDLCAVHSSMALAVNTFGPFIQAPERLRLLGEEWFTNSGFGRQLRSVFRGAAPQLVFLAYGPKSIVAVEGRFTEILSEKAADLPESYLGEFSKLADGEWAGMYRSLCDDPKRFQYLDAARLVKHYLGIRSSLGDESGRKSLLYLYWEPTNWRSVPEFAQHRYETLAFSMGVAGGATRFSAMSYPDLWTRWEAESTWSGTAAHVRNLRDRYVFSL